jgi:hypothetical protein
MLDWTTLTKIAWLTYSATFAAGILVGWALRSRHVALRRELRALWRNSADMMCPECYLGGGWEPGACDGCECREDCK